VSPAERRQRELDRIFAAGAAVVADWPPLTDEEIKHLAFIINPRLVAPTKRAKTATLPQAA